MKADIDRKQSELAFIGLGKIGQPMARRLIGAGYKLAVFDVNGDALRPFANDARVCSSAAETASQAEVVIACLQTVDQYINAILGPEGVIRGERVRTYVHVGTTGRECVRKLAGELLKRKIVTLDAPMSGGVAGAASGTLVSMVSGPRSTFDSVERYLSSYSRKIVYLGSEPGLAQAMKLVNNMLSAANLAAACEVMVVGAKAGIPVDIMLEVLNNGTGQNSATLTKIPNNIVPRTFNTGSSLNNVFKDLGAYAAEAATAGIDSTIYKTVVACYREAANQGTAEDDISTVVRPFERAAGVEVKRS
jgi:3-hydroxyisobutyrate dehydrogenase-like beta-hydroxyacid dehydrogenase